jgi:hypothetical protein
MVLPARLHNQRRAPYFLSIFASRSGGTTDTPWNVHLICLVEVLATSSLYTG